MGKRANRYCCCCNVWLMLWVLFGFSLWVISACAFLITWFFGHFKQKVIVIMGWGRGSRTRAGKPNGESATAAPPYLLWRKGREEEVSSLNRRERGAASLVQHPFCGWGFPWGGAKKNAISFTQKKKEKVDWDDPWTFLLSSDAIFQLFLDCSVGRYSVRPCLCLPESFVGGKCSIIL